MKLRYLKYIGLLSVIMLIQAGCGKDETPVSVYPPDIYYYEEEETEPAVPADIAMEDMNYETLTDFDMPAVIYYKCNPEEYYKNTTASVHFEQTQVSLQDGLRVIKLPVSIHMTGIYTEEDIDYSGCITPSFELVDKYSGVLFPTETAHGSGGYAYAGSIISDGNTINIDYTCDYSYTKGDWVSDGASGFTRNVDFEIVYTISMPDNYDGLALKVTPVERYVKYENDGNNHYANEYYPEGTRVFEIK